MEASRIEVDGKRGRDKKVLRSAGLQEKNKRGKPLKERSDFLNEELSTCTWQR